MADLKVGTTIGGSTAWHQGNLPLVPSGVKILYKGNRIYSEADKPTANELNVVSRDGDTMTQRLTIATTNDYPLAFNSTDSGPSKILFQRAGTTRLVMGMDAAGNFQLSANDAAGAHFGYGLQIWNSSLDATFGGSIQMPADKGWYVGKGGQAVLRDHNNGNVSLAALPNASGGSGDLYLGYNGTGMVTNTVRLESAMTWKSVRTLVNNDGYILRSAMDNPYFSQSEADNRYIRRNVNAVTDSYLLTKSVDYSAGSDGIPAGYSGFFRNNSSNGFMGLTMHVAHPGYANGAYARGLTFNYGGSNTVYTYAFDSAGNKQANIKIYTEADKPTPNEIGALAENANAVSASKLATGRRISLSGGASGSVVFDGSGDVTLPVTVANDSHTHSNYVKKTGDTMTGNLIVNAQVDANELQVGNSTHRARVIQSSGTIFFQGGSIAADQANNVAMSGWMGANLDLFQVRMTDGRSPVVRWGSTDYRLYHEGNRPSELVSISLSGKSCNSAVESGTYAILSGTTDTPFGTGPSGSTMQVSKWGDGGVQQMFFSYNADRVFVRRMEGGVWKSWFELYSTSKKPSASDVGALPVNGNAVSATRLQTARLISGVPFDGTSNITISANNVGAYSKSETDDLIKDSGKKTVVINKPAGITADFYVPVMLAGLRNHEDVYISTKTTGGSDPMNNCSFNGVVRSGGWSDQNSYVTGQFSIYQTNERALHSVYGGTEADGVVAFYVHEKAFPITVVVDGRVNVSTGASVSVETSVFTASANPATGNTKATMLAQWADGNGFYQGSSKTPTVQVFNTELDKKLDKSGGIMTGPIRWDAANEYINAASNNMYIAAKAGRVYLEGSANPMVRVGSTDSTIYHTGNKPTAGDVGAYPISGGTLSGNMTIRHSAPQLWFDETDTGKKYAFVADGNTIRLDEDNTSGTPVWRYTPGTGLELNNPVSFSAQGAPANALTRRDWVESQLNDKAHSSSNFAARYLSTRVLNGAAKPTTVGVWSVENSSWTPEAYGSLMVTSNLGEVGAGSGTGRWAHYWFQGHTSGAVWTARDVNGSFSGWQKSYDTKNKPTAADVGAIAASNGVSAGRLTLTGDLLSSGWLRTTGAVGWYNETYGGGMSMSDTTWVRTYGGKKFFVENTSTDAIYTAGGVNANVGIYDGGQRVYSPRNPQPNMTAAQVGAALAALPMDAVGQYAMMYLAVNQGGWLAPGTVRPGSHLRYSTAEGREPAGNIPPGNWRLHGRTNEGGNWGPWQTSIWQRVS
ncbi:long-tail fiber protein [Aeromonas phage avDM14-QBC]|nr:long-tail fiber protein [Aeromonas phage avDM14-QBC]UYD58653.1 long-tail fiber protein [Aeromonas phage avDM10-HWA]UYD59044.1 long-tail fiber protein [Aeromonas phage avDM7-IJDJ]